VAKSEPRPPVCGSQDAFDRPLKLLLPFQKPANK
jgi:hypothetical protein